MTIEYRPDEPVAVSYLRWVFEEEQLSNDEDAPIQDVETKVVTPSEGGCTNMTY